MSNSTYVYACGIHPYKEYGEHHNIAGLSLSLPIVLYLASTVEPLGITDFPLDIATKVGKRKPSDRCRVQ